MRIAGKPARQVVGSSGRGGARRVGRRIVAASLTVSIVGCSSPPSGGTQKSPSTENRGVQAVDSGTTSGPTNPTACRTRPPTIGTQARTGTVAGNVIENYKFLGFPNANARVSDERYGRTPRHLARGLLRPENKKYKLLHISVAAVWCNPCNQETDELVGDVASLAKRGSCSFRRWTSGPIGAWGATLGNLTQWIANKGSRLHDGPRPREQQSRRLLRCRRDPLEREYRRPHDGDLSAGVGYDGTEKSRHPDLGRLGRQQSSVRRSKAFRMTRTR